MGYPVGYRNSAARQLARPAGGFQNPPGPAAVPANENWRLPANDNFPRGGFKVSPLKLARVLRGYFGEEAVLWDAARNLLNALPGYAQPITDPARLLPSLGSLPLYKQWTTLPIWEY